MKGLKISVLSLMITVFTCFAIISISGNRALMSFKKINTNDKYPNHGIIIDEGTFPEDINYEFADSRNIYNIKCDTRSSVGIYDMVTEKSETLLTPVNETYKIDLFCKSGDYLIWKESGGPIDDQAEGSTQDWKIYIRNGNDITKADECKKAEMDDSSKTDIVPERLSAYDNYLVYRTRDYIPGTEDKGTILKLYDLNAKSAKAIFSLYDAKETIVSDPYIFKNMVSWSVYRINDDNSKTAEGDIYVYNIVSGSYSRLTESAPFINPVIWENYIICQRAEAYKSGIEIINTLNGARKEITSSNNSKVPAREVHDYSAGSGYVAWNTSYADSVCVYDILNDKEYVLKNSKRDDKTDNSLLNVYIYGKMLLYRDHVFSAKNGQTISEINRYIQLK